jgi:hypothetical protein
MLVIVALIYENRQVTIQYLSTAFYNNEEAEMATREWLHCKRTILPKRTLDPVHPIHSLPRTKLLQDPLQSRAMTFLLQCLKRFLSPGT